MKARDIECPTKPSKVASMSESKLNELIMELKSNQAKAKHEHYETMTRMDTRCGWMLLVLMLNCVLLLALLLNNFSG